MEILGAQEIWHTCEIKDIRAAAIDIDCFTIRIWASASTARNQWCAAVNNWGEFGRWGYVQIGNPPYAQAIELLDEAIDNLYADNPIPGLPTELIAFIEASARCRKPAR